MTRRQSGGAVLRVHSRLITMSERWFPTDECDDNVYEVYHKWFKALHRSADVGNHSVCSRGSADLAGARSSRTGVWFESHLMNSYDDARWMSALRMRRGTFLWICCQLEVDCWKKEFMFQPSIPLEAQLGGTLYHLMTGAEHEVIAEKFGMEYSSVRCTIEKCLASIVEILGHHLRWPVDDAMAAVSRGFVQKWSLPNCQGALGTTRVDVLFNEGDEAAAYEASTATRHSIALQAVCNSAGAFLNVFCAYPGTLSNSVVLQSSGLCHRATSGHILIEPLELLDSGELIRPYVLADTSYQLSPWLLVPESWTPIPDLVPHRNTLIHHHLQGRSCVELAFAELRRVFRSLGSGICCKPQTAPIFVHACCILHNMLLLRRDVTMKLPSPCSVDPLEPFEFQRSEGESVSPTDTSTDTENGETEEDMNESSEDDNIDVSSEVGDSGDFEDRRDALLEHMQLVLKEVRAVQSPEMESVVVEASVQSHDILE